MNPSGTIGPSSSSASPAMRNRDHAQNPLRGLPFLATLGRTLAEPSPDYNARRSDFFNDLAPEDKDHDDASSIIDPAWASCQECLDPHADFRFCAYEDGMCSVEDEFEHDDLKAPTLHEDGE